MRSIFILILISYLICKVVKTQRRVVTWPRRPVPSQYCVTPENYYGTCVTLSYCPEVLNVFYTTNQLAAQQYVIQLQRSCDTRSINGDPVICCTQPRQQLISTTPQPINPFPFTRGPPVTNRPLNPFFPTSRPPTINTERTTSTPRFTATTRTTTTTARTTPSINNQVKPKGNNCRDPKLMPGTCMLLKDCQVLIDELLEKQNDPVFTDYLRASNVQCGQVDKTVCCPISGDSNSGSTRRPSVRDIDDAPKRLPTLEEGCGVTSNAYKKIVGGTVSKKGAWPWIALIGYDDELAISPFKCGGTLITARHVLTAAHCIRNDLSFVRLGEHDLTTDAEAAHIDIPVVRKEAHPDYNKRNGRSDIAVLYMKSNVKFTDLIAPICLPSTPELRGKSYVKHTPFVVGWGKTMEGGISADVLQELQIPVLDNAVCEDRYRKQNRYFTVNQFDKAVICAGVLSGGKDTCQGDSGGPLMMPEAYKNSFRFYLIGVVSYGIGCARPDVPGVYSSTQYFMDWIIQKIADSP